MDRFTYTSSKLTGKQIVGLIYALDLFMQKCFNLNLNWVLLYVLLIETSEARNGNNRIPAHTVVGTRYCGCSGISVVLERH